MHCRPNSFDSKPLSLRSPGTLSSTNVHFGFKREQKHKFGSSFSVKSLLVKQDQKKSKPRMHRKDKNKTQKKQFPKNIQIKDVQTEFDGFFPPPRIVNTDVAEGYGYF